MERSHRQLSTRLFKGYAFTHVVEFLYSVSVFGQTFSYFDFIPDAIPVVGWTDDVTASASLVPMIMIYSNFSLEKLDEEIDEEEKRSRELKVGG